MANLIGVNETNFEKEVLQSDKLVLVDFWAPWCGPCLMIAPTVEQIAEEYKDVLKVVKLNTDENPAIAARYGIRGIPTLGIFKGGEMVDAIVGAVPKRMIVDKLKYFMAPA